jgi:hypothetical protein
VITYREIIADEIRAEGWSVGWVRAWVGNHLLWTVDANKGDGRRFIAQAEELTVAMLELQKSTTEQGPTPTER